MSCLFSCFFLVCMAMHACNARHLGVVMDNRNVSDKEQLFSTKVVENVQQAKEKSIIFHESDEEKPSDSGRQQTEMWGVVSVSDDRSGFFSDYSIPRTRPPSHN